MKPRLELYNHLEEGRLSPSVADALARAVRGQAVFHQAVQCIAHRRAAQPQVAGDGLFLELLAGAVMPADEPLPQNLVRLVFHVLHFSCTRVGRWVG